MKKLEDLSRIKHSELDRLEDAGKYQPGGCAKRKLGATSTTPSTPEELPDNLSRLDYKKLKAACGKEIDDLIADIDADDAEAAQVERDESLSAALAAFPPTPSLSQEPPRRTTKQWMEIQNLFIVDHNSTGGGIGVDFFGDGAVRNLHEELEMYDEMYAEAATRAGIVEEDSDDNSD